MFYGNSSGGWHQARTRGADSVSIAWRTGLLALPLAERLISH